MKIKVTLKKSIIGSTKLQQENLRTLGVTTTIGKSIFVSNTPDIRGKIKKVLHLVKVEEVAEK